MKQASRFGIGEWYGQAFLGLSATERQASVASYLGTSPVPPCPFGMRKGPCNKIGGVCSLQPFINKDGFAYAVDDVDPELRVICPRRFEEDSKVVQWVGETMLGTTTPSIVSEIGFLRSRQSKKHVGRIDMVLTNSPAPGKQIDWCALEMQEVYFSGPKMGDEIKAIAASVGELAPYPSAIRRPDYRSSGPKRLMPQLQMKVPTLRRWGKKMAVVIDRRFHAALGQMEVVDDISSADIAWFTVDLALLPDKKRFKLVKDKLYLTTLERTVEGLMGASPVTQMDFENDIRAKLARVK